MSVAMLLDTSSLNAIVDEIGEAVESAVRPAAQAAADVLYHEVRQNVGKIGRKSGKLAEAIYQAFADGQSAPGVAVYNVSWNAKKAPHGHLLEYGHIQRYAAYIGKDGNWHTAVRPEMRGKPKPKGRASQAEKDAYYVLRKGGPQQVTAQAFVRRARDKFPAALAAAEAELLKRIAS
jgi:hypothetical protein